MRIPGFAFRTTLRAGLRAGATACAAVSILGAGRTVAAQATTGGGGLPRIVTRPAPPPVQPTPPLGVPFRTPMPLGRSGQPPVARAFHRFHRRFIPGFALLGFPFFLDNGVLLSDEAPYDMATSPAPMRSKLIAVAGGGATLEVTPISSDSVRLTYPAQGEDAHDATFFVADTAERRVHEENVSAAPFTAVLKVSRSTAYVGVTVRFVSGAKVTTLLPFLPSSR